MLGVYRYECGPRIELIYSRSKTWLTAYPVPTRNPFGETLMSAFRHVLLVLPLVLGLTVASGCSSRKVIDASSTEAIIASVDKGDQVRITTRNDAVHKFVVTKITNKALYGDNARVVYEDMQSVELLDKGDGDADDDGKGGFWSRLF